MTQPHPFDHLAADYDRDFSASPIARLLRDRVHARLAGHFPAGAHLLELGCGTGEDARRLAERGVRVTATDASPLMLARTRAKTAHLALIDVAPLDLDALPPDALAGPYDGVFSNFGPLNCLETWTPLARWLAARLPTGGIAAFGIMSRWCVWEAVWHGLHGDFRTAARRWGGRSGFTPAPGAAPITIRYPSPGELAGELAPWFQRISLEPLGLLLPPTAIYSVIERRRRLLRALARLDALTPRLSGLASLADHYWITLRRTHAPAPLD